MKKYFVLGIIGIFLLITISSQVSATGHLTFTLGKNTTIIGETVPSTLSFDYPGETIVSMRIESTGDLTQPFFQNHNSSSGSAYHPIIHSNEGNFELKAIIQLQNGTEIESHPQYLRVKASETTATLEIDKNNLEIGEILTATMDYDSDSMNITKIELTSDGDSIYEVDFDTPTKKITKQTQKSFSSGQHTLKAVFTLENSTIIYSEEKIIQVTNTNNPTVTFSLNPSETEINNEVSVSISYNSQNSPVKKIEIKTNGQTLNEKTVSPPKNSDSLTMTISKDSQGTYPIKVILTLENGDSVESETKNLKINKKQSTDNPPEITLIAPKDGTVIKSSKTTFSFKVEDDFKVDYCTYETYQVKGAFKELDYTQTINKINLGEVINIPLTEFDDANYTWYITCTDNASQESKEQRNFEIRTVTHSRQKEIKSLIEKIDDFLKAKETKNQEEQNALEEIKIIEDLRYYKKRLIQIDQDLGNNLKYISDETLRQKRTREANEELDEIKIQIPTESKIIDSKEFIKNSLSQDIEKITRDYVQSKKINLEENEIIELAKKNEQIQTKLLTSTNIKQIEITFNSKKEKITLIKKKIEISDPQFKTILEVVPEEIKNEIEFEIPVKKINGNIYEINYEDLKDGLITYRIKGEISLKDAEKIDTILFREFPLSELMGPGLFSGMTGYFVFGSGETTYDYTLIIIFLILFIIYFLITKYFYLFRMHYWKKEEDVVRTLKYVEESKKNLKEENLEGAKEKYHKIKEIFKLLPEGFRKYIYPEIKKIQIGINRREISNLIEEYENDKRRGMIKDAKEIYNKIKEKYKILPKKYKEKVYERVIKNSI